MSPSENQRPHAKGKEKAHSAPAQEEEYGVAESWRDAWVPNADFRKLERKAVGFGKSVNALPAIPFQPLRQLNVQVPLSERREVPFRPTGNRFTFIDLFAGIGGFRLAAQALGGQCVFSSEFDANAQKTYCHNFGEMPYGDITQAETKAAIPNDFDLLFAGFPCQPFSIAGYRKGFGDTRGTLFYDIAEILKAKRPRAIFLENVKNLASHDGGKTFTIIQRTLRDLGYCVFHKVMNAMVHANIPQNRERIFIVCFDPTRVPRCGDFQFPKEQRLTRTVHDCIAPSPKDPRLVYTKAMSHFDDLRQQITDPNSIYQWRRQYVRKNQSHVCPTLTANMGTGGHNVPLIIQNNVIRKLSPKECLNFQGFPKAYDFPEAIPQSAKYKQAGNSVVVPLIQAVCSEMLNVMELS